MRIPLFLLGLLATGLAMAEPDTFGLGTGRNGALSVALPNTVINRYGQLTASAAAGTKDLVISNATAFAAGELVLVHQSTGLSAAPDTGNQRAINLSTSALGRFEYARVESVTGGSLRLTAPLQYGYEASVSQVVNVPEYTNVQVLAGASLKAVPWNGSVGGILALLATGTLTNEGLVGADGMGFRGGAFVNHSGISGCTSLDEAAGSGGSYKGEGVVAGRFGTASGRGNLTNGGGSGVCHNSGGAGGGHSGLGGKGGFSLDVVGTPQDTGGLGGAPLLYLPYEHLVFGGGGGAGGGHESLGTAGATGGGVLILRAGDVAGSGRFSAMGAPADFVPSASDDGAGGGGAGGAISLRVARALTCGLAQASGGAGGDTRHTTSASGPGGGGGGGVVFLQGETITCPASVVAGYSGQSTTAGGPFGAGPSTIDGGTAYGSEQTYQVPFRVPTPPTLSQPANGATGVERRPLIQGTTEPGVVVHLFLDGVAYVNVVAANTGAFSYSVPKDLTGGTHELRASAEVFGSYSPLSAPNRFDVVTPVPDGGVDGGTGGGTDGGTDGGIPDGGSTEEEPVLESPAEDEEVGPTPLFAGKSATGVSVSIEVDNDEVARVPLDDQRRFRYVLTAEQKLDFGAHKAVVRAWDEAGNEGLSSPKRRFKVRPPEALEVGCGCGASTGAGFGAMALLLGLRALRPRRRDPAR